MTDVQIPAPGVKAAPLVYTVPGSVELVLKAAFATFDGSGAGGAFLPCLRVLSPAGLVVGEYITDASVAAGSSAEVSFGPFLRSAGGGGAATAPAEWCALHSAGITNPLAFNFFTSSNTDVFATATSAAPTVVSNTTGDKMLMLRASGSYLITVWAHMANTVAATNTWLDTTTFGNLFDIESVAGGTYGDLTLHGTAMAGLQPGTLLSNGDVAWAYDARLYQVNTASAPNRYKGFGFGTSGVISSVDLYAAAYYWPTEVGVNIY